MHGHESGRAAQLACVVVNPSRLLSVCLLLIQEHERVLSLVPPVTRSLLRPHLEDVDNKIQPGAVILTWASMNIDGYLHHIHQACRCRPSAVLGHPPRLLAALRIGGHQSGFAIAQDAAAGDVQHQSCAHSKRRLRLVGLAVVCDILLHGRLSSCL